MCFASQTSGLCASLFSSLPLLHTSFLSVCFASQAMILRSTVFPSPLWVFVRLSDLCTLWYIYFFRVFRIARFGFAEYIHSVPCYLLISSFVSFLSVILFFRIFCLLTVFCLVLFSLSSHYHAYLISCFKRSSFASLTMVLCSSYFCPLLASAFLFGFIVLESFFCFANFAAHSFAFVQCYSLDAYFWFIVFVCLFFSMFSFCVSCLPNLRLWSSVRAPIFEF